MNLPKITKKQQAIVRLLYSHRFLNRVQIQAFLGHKDYKTINLWLRDLRQKQCVGWIYSTKITEKHKPAVYYLSLNGIRLLKQQLPIENKETDEECEAYPTLELRKRYYDKTRSRSFIDRCILLGNCCIDLVQPREDGSYRTYETEADYQNEASRLHFLADNEYIRPQLVYWRYSAQRKPQFTYLVEAFDTNLPRYRIKKQLGNYIQFLDSGDWESETGEARLPIIMFICPRTTDLIYAKRRTRGLLAELWDSDDTDRPVIQFAVADRIKEQGFIGKAWEQA
jgi:hypothetical protein